MAATSTVSTAVNLNQVDLLQGRLHPMLKKTLPGGALPNKPSRVPTVSCTVQTTICVYEKPMDVGNKKNFVV